MATVSRESLTAIDPTTVNPAEPTGSPPRSSWFDRSSITADAMVTIRGVSEEDWWEHAPESQICEFLDGVVYMPSPATDEHQDMVSLWFDLLNGFRLAKTLAVRVRLGPAVLRLADGRNPEPDLFVVPQPPPVEGPPAVLIVEVLSNSTRAHDLGLKAEAFRNRAIPELVFIDLARPRLIVHNRVDDLYTVNIVEEGVRSSTSLPGFWLDVDWLWHYDATDPRACLELILAGPPA